MLQVRKSCLWNMTLREDTLKRKYATFRVSEQTISRLIVWRTLVKDVAFQVKLSKKKKSLSSWMTFVRSEVYCHLGSGNVQFGNVYESQKELCCRHVRGTVTLKFMARITMLRHVVSS